MKYVVEDGHKTDIVKVWVGYKYNIEREDNKIIITSDYGNKEVINEEEKKDIIKSFSPSTNGGKKPIKIKNKTTSDLNELKTIYLHKLVDGTPNPDYRIEQKISNDKNIVYKFYAPCPRCGDKETSKKKNSIHSNGKQRYWCSECGLSGIGSTFGLPNNNDDIEMAIEYGTIDKFSGVKV
jgi:predicted RNA-binding Zn-ribbon protein involved in translation (DUF1610 family)